MTYTISTIKSVLNGEWAVPQQADTVIEHLLIDSRKIAFPHTSLFFAIIGKRNDGHHFIADVYAAGVRNFIISKSENIDFQRFSDANFIKVTDVLRGIQDLAAYHRAQFPNLKVIGITGSNGKTIVKEWLYQLLKDDFNIVRSPKSYNSQVGVPLSVWQINTAHNLGIFEAGISTTNEMAALEKMIQPQIGIFTNLGEAHTEGFASDEVKLVEKLKLFKNVEKLVIQDSILKKYPNTTISATILNDNDSVKIIDYQCFKNKTEIQIQIQGKILFIEIPFTDTASIDNAVSCFKAIALINPDLINEKWLEKFKYLEPVAMRLELKAGINNCLVVNDAYNLDFNALQIALDFINQQSRQLKRTLVLSDILQSGVDSAILYKKVADLVLEKGVSKLIGIGEQVQLLSTFLPFEKQNNIEFYFFKTTSEFLKSIKNADFQNEIILLKGARLYEFERIAERLAQKTHKTVLEINLNALSHNLAYFKSLLKPATKLMAMVKASAYGNGSDEVARLLEFHKVDYLAVAYSDEGIALRNAGVRLPIMVMNPEEESFDALRRYQLEPEIYSIGILKNYVAYVQDFTESNNDTKTAFKIHLKLDTGMHRLGFESVDIQEVITILNKNVNIRIATVFTHLAATEAAEHDGFTQEQVGRFVAMYGTLTEGVGYKPIRHVLNSSGITRHADYHFDMVRLGIGLYGIDSNGAFQNNLKVVQTLKASISQIKNIPKGDSIGYSRRGQAVHDMRIATISIGYADGLSRGLGNGQFAVYVRGKRAAIVGSVCMDMTMVNVTDIPEAMEGDEVEIFGSHIPVQELAEKLNTIPYEIFTGISERVKRVYFQE